MKIKSLAVLSVCCLFFLLPVSNAQADDPIEDDPNETEENFTPNFDFSGQIVAPGLIEVFPLALDNFAGFDSLLAVSNFNSTTAMFRVCGLPIGGQSFSCTFLTLGAFGTEFVELPSIGIMNTAGQIQVNATDSVSVGGSTLIVFLTTGGAGMSFVAPTTFQTGP